MSPYAVFLMLYDEEADSIYDRIGAGNGTRARFRMPPKRAARSGAV